ASVLSEERRVKAIFESMAEGMLTVNAEGWITAANESLLTLLHQDMNDLVGQKASQAIHISAESGFSAFMEQVLQSSDEFPQLACNITLNGNGRSHVPVLISGAPIVNDDNEVYETIFVFSDLSQIREVERMRDDFFHGIVHELRTPLATILMYTHLLREGRAKDDEAKADRFLGVIERESDRLQTMVRQMLQLAKLEASQIQRSSELVNLNRLFDQLLPPMADQATEKSLTFVQRIQADLPPIQGVEETLYLIFKNLVENGIKFTLKGTVRVEAQLDGKMIQVRVKDNGIGIPKEAMPNLFRRFYRAQSAVEKGIAGTGLGLHMVKEGVEKHGGTIEVQSTEGEGTTFTVRLPIAPQ
ncbi:MAG: PAS domain-containing protein, partial [Chloroflexi bacterium]|nr:PAS domain-containing protein [Chloroflexota bacterium]